MGEFKFEAIVVLVILLPGFLAARIEQRLTVNREQSELDRIVEALLYSFATYFCFSLFTHSFPVTFKVETKGDTSYYSIETNIHRLALLAAIAIVLSILISYAVNNDLFGRLFR